MAFNNIARRPKFFIFNGAVTAPLLLLMLYPRLSTLYFLIGVSIGLYILERKGISLFVLMRKIRTFLIGKKRYIRPFWRKKL